MALAPRSPKPELLKALVAALDALPAAANGHSNGQANGHAHGHAHGHADGHAQLRSALLDTASLESYLNPRHVLDVLLDAAPAKLSVTQVLARRRCSL